MAPEEKASRAVEVPDGPVVPYMMPAIKTSCTSGELSGSEGSDCSGGKPKPTARESPDPVDTEVIALSPRTLLATHRFICDICKKGFQRDQNLQLHLRGHNLPWKLPRQRFPGEAKRKVYVCPVPTCLHHDPSRALGDLTGVKKHYSRKHGEKKFKCGSCPKMYAVQCDWKAHEKTCGRRKYHCTCGVIMNKRENLTAHKMFCGFGPDKEDLDMDTSMKAPVQQGTLTGSPSPSPSSPGSPNCGVAKEPANLGLRLGCMTPRAYNSPGPNQDDLQLRAYNSPGPNQEDLQLRHRKAACEEILQQSFASLPVTDKGRRVAFLGEAGVANGARPCSLVNHVFSSGNQQSLGPEQGAANHGPPSLFFRGVTQRCENPELGLYQNCHATSPGMGGVAEDGRHDFTHSYSFLEDMQLLQQQRQQQEAARMSTNCTGQCTPMQKVLQANLVNYGIGHCQHRAEATKFHGSAPTPGSLFPNQWMPAHMMPQALQMPLVRGDEHCPQHSQLSFRGEAIQQEQQRLGCHLQAPSPWLFGMTQGANNASHPPPPYAAADVGDSHALLMMGSTAPGHYGRSSSALCVGGVNGDTDVEGYDMLMGSSSNWNSEADDYQELGTITRDFLGLSSRSTGDIGCYGAIHGACDVN